MSSKEWNDFKNKYPEMENFFHMEFESLSDYQREKVKWCDKYFQQLATANSETIKFNEVLQSQFYYKRLRLKCKHGGKARSNKRDNTRPMQHKNCFECPFYATLVYNADKNRLVFCDYNLTHNHIVSEVTYNSYTEVKTKKLKEEATSKLASVLISAKTSTYETKQALSNNFHIKGN